MDEIRLLNVNEIAQYMEIVANAFPYFQLQTPADKEKYGQRIIKSIEAGYSAGAYGSFRAGELIGGMRFYDFMMNVFNHKIIMGGLGLIAVGLANKKEKVCSRMVQYFLEHYYKKQTFLVGLFAFRPDFYKKMGFGYGSKNRQYQVTSSQLPQKPKEKTIRLLQKNEKQLIVDYYNRYMEKHHGCIQLSAFEVERLFEDNKKIAVYWKNGNLKGYIVFYFKHRRKDKYHIYVTQMLYDDRRVLAELLCFLRSQSDQSEKIIIDTYDEYFHFLPENPVNGENLIYLHHQTNVEEIGIMYRVINNKLLFESLKGHNFGGISQTVKMNINDNYFLKNNESITVKFTNGYPQLTEDEKNQIEIKMDISDFSSMILGVVPFSALYHYSKAEISDQDSISVIDCLFSGVEKPICHTRF